ncbi:MAG: hypothetical protein AB8I08_06600 [Sandaracinaceae bacterium]
MRLASLVALVCLLPATASASSGVLLPRTGGSGMDAAARDEVVAAVVRVLENESLEVFRTEEVSTQLPPELAACGPDDGCAWTLAQHLEVDAAVGVRVWGEASRVERIGVVIVDRRGAQRAVAEVDAELPIDFAAAEATRGALTAWRTGRAAFRPPSPANPAALDDAEVRGDPLNWALGALLVLGSSPMLGYGINTIVRSGDCVTEGPGGTCVERVRFQEGAGIFTGIGAVMLIAGVVVWIAQPIRMSVRASHESASVELSGRF